MRFDDFVLRDRILVRCGTESLSGKGGNPSQNRYRPYTPNVDTCFAKPRPRTPTESTVAAKGARFDFCTGVRFSCPRSFHCFREIPSGSGATSASEILKFTVRFSCTGSVGETGFWETFFFFAVLITWERARINKGPNNSNGPTETDLRRILLSRTHDRAERATVTARRRNESKNRRNASQLQPVTFISCSRLPRVFSHRCATYESILESLQSFRVFFVEDYRFQVSSQKNPKALEGFHGTLGTVHRLRSGPM